MLYFEPDSVSAVGVFPLTAGSDIILTSRTHE